LENESLAFVSLNGVLIRNRASLSKSAAFSGRVVVEVEDPRSECRNPANNEFTEVKNGFTDVKPRPTKPAARMTLPMTFVKVVP
jgi:hypothetical protein